MRCSPTCAIGAAEERGDRGAARADADATAASSWPALPRRCAAAWTPAGKLLALGNGGSATDAMDVVADLREPPRRLARAAARWT